MKLGDKVGRTYEEDPKIDLKLPWGMLNGLPVSVLTTAEPVDEEAPVAAEEPAAEGETASDNVTQIRVAARKARKITRAAGLARSWPTAWADEMDRQSGVAGLSLGPPFMLFQRSS